MHVITYIMTGLLVLITLFMCVCMIAIFKLLIIYSDSCSDFDN